MGLVKELQNLVDPTPTAFDPDQDDSDHLTSARIVDFEENLDEDHNAGKRSSIRKALGTNLAEDERYKGKITHRHKISSDVEEFSEDDGDLMSDEGDQIDFEDDPESDDLENDDQENRSDKISCSTKSVADENLDDDEETLKTFSRVNAADELAKAQAVQKQLRLWERLLATRIRLQRITALVNRLPQNQGAWSNLIGSCDEAKAGTDACRKGMKNLLDNCAKLQNIVYRSNPATKHLVAGGATAAPPSDDDDEILSSLDEGEQVSVVAEIQSDKKLKLGEYYEVLAKKHENFRQYRNKILMQWHEKTKLASGKVGGKNDFSSFDKNVVQQIEQVLSDESRLLRRTQMKRSYFTVLGKRKNDGSVAGEVDEEDYDEEIFDDDDFYHQLLREVIERKAVGVTDPHALGRQWLEVQKLRSKVKKKLVDRKASKARKVRYDVMPKLVNFMAPVDVGSVLNDTRQELFRSLFHKYVA